ncbi:MAG: hypothetical protein RL204_1297 [Bacteroidota bacterium]|jgi:glycosyltransferase involved in cell wall biosynthesis
MDKLKIAVYIDPDYKPQVGGGYSYASKLVGLIDQYHFDDQIEIVFIGENNLGKNVFSKNFIHIPKDEFIRETWSFGNKLKLKALQLLPFGKGLLTEIIAEQKKQINEKVVDFINDNKIDLVYYLKPESHPYDTSYIMTHWDLGHKTMFAFPEVTLDSNYEKREKYHRIELQKAFAIFTESDTSVEELLQFERINKDRMFVLPLMPGKVVDMNVSQQEQSDILKKWSLEIEQYFFYPAQFWAHKNHYALIKAFDIVSKQNQKLKLVLSGSDKGNRRYIEELVASLNLSDKVLFVGFISDEEVHALYRNAKALVMPTLLGPTNMPLLEAHVLGCPVLCSNLKGHIQQMGNKAIYFDPIDPADIANKMSSAIPRHKPYQDETDYGKILNENFLKLIPLRRTFGKTR